MDNVALALSGRDFKDSELRLVKEIVEMYPLLTRIELVETICENMELFTQSNKDKKQFCIKLLEKLEEDGVITLKQRKSRRIKSIKK